MLSRTRLLRVAAPVAVAATLAGAALTAAAHSAPAVTSGRVTLPTTDDAGNATTFGLQWAATAQPASLVVVFHGHGHNGDEWQAAGELTTAAARDNAIVVAPETTETTAPNGKGTFDTVDEEARDAASAITWARATYHPQATYLFCVSMGCSGLADFIDTAAHSVGHITGILVAEGLSNLVETWAEAAAADPTSQHEIEAETGGTPQTAAAAYRARSLALLPTHALASLHLRQAAVVHDVDDGLVPVNQAAETRAALGAARVPFHGYTVVRNGKRTVGCSTDHQTTGTSYVGAYAQQYAGDATVANTLDPTLCLAGHASEISPDTPVMHASFNVLHDMTTTGIGRGETPVSIIVK